MIYIYRKQLLCSAGVREVFGIWEDFLKPDEIPMLIASFFSSSKAILGQLAEVQSVRVALQEFYLFVQRKEELSFLTVPEQELLIPGKKGGFPFDTHPFKDQISLYVYQMIEGKEADDAA